MVHTPVFTKEVLFYLDAKPGKHYIDATADGGGHTIAIIHAVQPDGKILAVEWDEELFQQLIRRLKKECSHFSKNYILRQASYTALARLVRSLRFSPVAGVLFDFGISSFHLEVSRRGFSFQRAEELDMRYSRATSETAAQILARRTEKELETILKNFGQERFAGRIAKGISEARRRHPIRTTLELVAIIRKSTPQWYHRKRLHFATRTFQALRIAVNHELENIAQGLEAAAEVISPAGRIVTITFHSLEDRTVKNFFRRPDIKPHFSAMLEKPLRPQVCEIRNNPRARSAVLRAFEKIS
ncbi:MAG: 16S rRNA (cytosine(1402)-N(4))-methyltransferase RsmH [Patescibacteria group bacterium]